MSKIIVSEGKTTSEAIEKGLKELNLHRDQVEIGVLEQEKRSFFDILAPRVVKVELTVKEKLQKEEKILTEEDLEETKNNLEKFIKEFLKNLGEEYKYDINIEKNAEYKDKDSISEYAVNAVDWNNQNDIMTGDTDGKFEPKSNTTRAQAASVLMRISENFK